MCICGRRATTNAHALDRLARFHEFHSVEKSLPRLRNQVWAGAVLLLALACGPAADDAATTAQQPTGNTTSASSTTAAPEPSTSDLGAILDAIRAGGADERCDELGQALGLGPPLTSARSACSFDSMPSVTISFAPGSNLESFTAEAESQGGGALEICDGGYEVSGSGTYTLGAHDAARSLLYLVNIPSGEDTSSAPGLATAMCTA